ncbi:MAG: hypothetical protein NC320_13150 [Clostridium sp.]|nr:hypothetical protein [Clostridium sp.]
MDKKCKRFLNHLHECERYSLKYDDIKNLTFLSKFLESEIEKMIDYLEDEGYINADKALSGNYRSVELTYKGINWKYFRYQEVLKYLKDKWIDFLAMSTSIVALVISLISLLK